MKKNNISYAILTILSMLVLLLSACSDDENTGLQFSEDAVNVFITPTSISTFDTNPTFELSTKSNSNQIISGVTVFLEGFTEEDGTRTRTIGQLEEIATANFSGNATTEISIASQDLKLEDIDDISFLHLQTNGATTPSVSIHELSVFEATTANITTNLLEAQTTVEDTLNYTITTRGAVVDEVIIEQKIFFDGTYTEIPSTEATWPVDEGSYRFTSANYAINDTVYFRVTANSGGLTSMSDEIKVFIDTQRINGISGDFELNKDVAQYNLEKASVVEEPEIIFVPETMNLQVGMDTSMQLVEIPAMQGEEIFEALDLIAANTTFNNGTPASIISPQAGSVYVYKITRKDADDKDINSTGLLKINTITTTNSDGDISLNISYAEEEDI